MNRIAIVVPPGHGMPAWLESDCGPVQATRIEWTPGNPLRLNPADFHAVVAAGWNDPAELLGALSRKVLSSLEPGPFPVGLVGSDAPAGRFPGVECLGLEAVGNPPEAVARACQSQWRRRVAGRFRILSATVCLLAVWAAMAAGLALLWTMPLDPTLRRGLLLIDGLEGKRPWLIHGESLQALHDRALAIEAWNPDSAASGEIAERVSRAGERLALWLAPLNEAANWPEVEDSGTLDRLATIAKGAARFPSDIPGFSDAPLGREALARRDEIIQAAADAARHIAKARLSLDARRAMLALRGFSPERGPDWVEWHRETSKLMGETGEVPADSPVLALEEIRRTALEESESLADLARARQWVELLGLAGSGPALLVPPDSGADADLATRRLGLVLKANPHAMGDFSAAGLPAAFVTSIRGRILECRAGWLSGGGGQVAQLIRPSPTGAGNWSESVEKGKGIPVVAGWNQWVGLFSRMSENGGGGGPVDELAAYLRETRRDLAIKAAIVDLPEKPVAQVSLVLENKDRPGSRLRLEQVTVEKANGNWRVTLRPASSGPLPWLPGEACEARLMGGAVSLAYWGGRQGRALGTEWIWGKSESGIPAILGWEPPPVAKPPGWFVDSIR